MIADKLVVEFTFDTEKVITMLEEMADILRPYDLSDDDTDRISKLLKSGMKITKNKER